MVEATMAKGEFAALIGVSPGRVTQMITQGLIGAEALDGEGRSARIRVELAKRQIAARRNPGQALGNGLQTRLGEAAGVAEEAVPGKPESLDEQFKRERLRRAQIDNRKAAEEEEKRLGRFTDTGDARSQMLRVAGQMLQSFEGMLPLFATAIAGKFAVPQRDVLHLLRQEFRDNRLKAAAKHAQRADDLPAAVESIVASAEELAA